MHPPNELVFKVLVDDPISIRLLVYPSGHARKAIGLAIESAIKELFPLNLDPHLLYRGVEWSGLSRVLKNGCDVEPADAPFFAGHLSKALEYGCTGDQVIQVFRASYLKPSWEEHSPSSLSQTRLGELESLYQTKLITTDGKRLLFSRFPKSDTRTGTPYEREYGYWIPRESFKALVGVILIVENLENLSIA